MVKSLETIMVSKEEKEWIMNHSPYRKVVSVCPMCGLPKEICVCEEIKRRAKSKGLCPICCIPSEICLHSKIGKEFLNKIKSKDDFLYCNQCNVFHYRGCHIPKQKENKQ